MLVITERFHAGQDFSFEKLEAGTAAGRHVADPILDPAQFDGTSRATPSPW